MDNHSFKVVLEIPASPQSEFMLTVAAGKKVQEHLVVIKVTDIAHLEQISLSRPNMLV